ncbi:MAG: protein kinase, partial [Planctomycetota bacterium]|nr:protein kinase [Planctomycetota bacterium]
MGKTPAPELAGLGEETLYCNAAAAAPPPAAAPPAQTGKRPVAEPLPETLGPYEVIQLIGRGGMGTVLKGRDNALKRDVAIKIVRPDVHAGTAQRMRFIKEAQITGQLEHPGIAPVHYLGWDDSGREFFSMKLVSGFPLNSILERWHAGDAAVRSELPLPRLVAIFERVCETVSFAHSRRVIHRDLKPSNVMIGKHGEVWVLDWGLAKVLGEPQEKRGSDSLPADLGNDVTLDGTIVGTPEYMAPEQAAGETNDEGVDIFGLGALLYEILTGQPPYSGKSVREVVTKAVHGRFTPLARTAGGRKAPPALAAIARKAMARDRRERYASVDELLRDLRAYAVGDSISALPDTVFDRLRRFAHRHGRGVAIAATAALVLLSIITTAAILVAQKDRQARDAEREKQRTVAAAADKAQKRLKAFGPFAQAMDSLMRGQLSERAAELLREALAIDSEFPEAQFALGEALRSSGLPVEAAAAYLKANELSIGISGRTNLHAIVAAGLAYDSAGFYAEAEDAYALAEKEGADDPLALVGRAFRLGRHRKLREARQVAEEALKRGPHLWETHFAVGYVLSESLEDGLLAPAQWRKPAIAALKDALDLAPRQAEICMWLCLAAGRQHTAEASAEAAAYLERAIALEPKNGSRYAIRGVNRLSAGNPEGAEQDMATARRLGVCAMQSLVYDARKAVQRNDLAEAFRLMGEVVQKTREWPSHMTNWLNLGISLGKYDEVKPALERWAAQNPEYPQVFALRGALRAREND